MTGMERLLGFYNTAPPESMQATIVRTILTNIDRVSDLTIYELSELCYTSPASLSRLVRKLGYKNFAYFQKDITDCVEKYDRHNRLVSPEAKPENKSMQSFFLDTLEELYNRFKEELDEEKTIELVNMIHEAEKVNLFSYSVYLMELFLQSDLFMSGKICELRQQEKEIFESIDSMTEKDLAILVSPAASEGLPSEKLVKQIHKAGAKVCLITESRNIEKNAKADLSIILPGVHQAADMFIMQLFLGIVDMTYRDFYL